MKKSNIKIEQVAQEAIISIGAHTDSSQTMVKLCKNGEEWLSPTGWSTTEKSTLLDSERAGSATKFSIPDDFAASIKNGDSLTLSIASIDFEGSIIWQKEEATTTSSMLAAAIAKTGKQSKRGLFGRFGGADTPQEAPQSEVERLAEQARLVAEASTADMRRAHEAKQAAEQRALEAARLAEAAHKMEQDVIAEAKRAEQALIKAEAARRTEEKRKQAERKAEEARLLEQARLAELAKREEQARQLEAQCSADIERMGTELTSTKDAIRTFENRADELAIGAEKAEEFVKSQSEIETQAKRTFALAERKVLEGEVENLKRQQAEQVAKDQYSQLEKDLSEHQKQTARAANQAQKASSALSDAEASAKTAIAKANELRVTAQAAEDGVQSLQRKLNTAQQQSQELAVEKDRTEAAQMSARSVLEQVKTTMGAASASLKDASAVHAEAGNTLRQTDGLIADNHTLLQESRALATNLRARVKHLKAQKITPDNVEDMVDILTAEPELKNGDVVKAVTLASGAVVGMDSSAEDGMISKFKNLFRRERDDNPPAETEISSTDDNTAPEIDEPETQSETQMVEKPAEIKSDIDKDVDPDSDSDLGQSQAEMASVKLVSETDEKDLPASDLEDDHEDDESGKSRKIAIGLSAVLLASVASIGLVNILSSKPTTQQTANVEKTRIEAQAVLPAAITTTPPMDDVLKKKISDTESLSTPVAVTLVPTPETQVLEELVLEELVPEALGDEKPILQLAENTVDVPIFLRSTTRTVSALGINLESAEDDFFPPKLGRLFGIEVSLPEPVQGAAPIEEASLNIPAQEVEKIRIEEKPVEIAVPTKKTQGKKPQAKKIAALPTKPKTTVVKRTEPKPSLEDPLIPEKQNIPKPTTPQFSEVTKDVQSKLQAFGFYQGEPNGLMDGATTSAITRFEEVFGLQISGKITPVLLSGLDNTRVAQTPPLQEQPEAEQEVVLEASLTPVPVTIEAPKEPEAKPDLIVQAEKTAVVAATYPRVAVRRGHDKNTTVVVVYDVDANGVVTNATVKKSIGGGRFKTAFEKAAIKAAEKAKFAPKTVNGEAVASQNHETKFTFNIE